MKSPRARRKGRRPRKIATKSTNRTEKKFIRKITHKVCQKTNVERARKRASLGLRLSPKFRKVRLEEVLPGRRNLSRDSLQLTHPTSSRQRNQEEHLPGKVTKRTRRERLKGRASEKRQNTKDPTGEPEKKREDAQDERSGGDHEEQRERKAQEEQSERHHSTWSSKMQ